MMVNFLQTLVAGDLQGRPTDTPISRYLSSPRRVGYDELPISSKTTAAAGGTFQ